MFITTFFLLGFCAAGFTVSFLLFSSNVGYPAAWRKRETSFALRRRSWIFLLQASLFSCIRAVRQNKAGDTQGGIFSCLDFLLFLGEGQLLVRPRKLYVYIVFATSRNEV